MPEQQALDTISLPDRLDWPSSEAFSSGENECLADFRAKLEGLNSVVVGYSGGVDSSVLAYAARRWLGREKTIALLVDSPSLARREKSAAIALARHFDFALEVVAGREMENENYLKNRADRCFHCKSDMVSHILAARKRHGFEAGAYGLNADDGLDFRPGQRAAKLGGIHAPLAEAGLDKAMVRRLAKGWNLPVWDKPAMPCLSSRIPHGIPVSVDLLQRIEKAEDHLAALGFRAYRVRAESGGARVEIAREEWGDLETNGVWPGLESHLSRLGFAFVRLDPLGLQPGGLSSRLSEGEKNAALNP